MFPCEYHVCYCFHLLLPFCEGLIACCSSATSSLASGVRAQYLLSLWQHFKISLVGICLPEELLTTLLFHETIVSKHRYPTALILDILLLPGPVTRLRHYRGKPEKIRFFSAHLLPLPSCTDVFVNYFIRFEFVRPTKTFPSEQRQKGEPFLKKKTQYFLLKLSNPATLASFPPLSDVLLPLGNMF